MGEIGIWLFHHLFNEIFSIRKMPQQMENEQYGPWKLSDLRAGEGGVEGAIIRTEMVNLENVAGKKEASYAYTGYMTCLTG